MPGSPSTYVLLAREMAAEEKRNAEEKQGSEQKEACLQYQ
jgi:hypothetical protein